MKQRTKTPNDYKEGKVELGAERSKVKIQKLNEMKSWFFKKMKKLIKPLLEKKKSFK